MVTYRMLATRIGGYTLAVLAALMFMVPAAQAVTMDTLVGGGSITCGDKVFSQFTYSATGDNPAASGVNVDCITVSGNIGIRFQGGFVDAPGGDASDALITYTVTVTDPTKLIVDAHLSGNPDVLGTTGAVAITETFTPDSNNQMSAFDIIGVGTQLSDSTIFAQGFTVLHVQKDILLDGGTSGLATLSFVDQTFSQTSVPEPGALVLLGAGLLGLFGYASWRRRD